MFVRDERFRLLALLLSLFLIFASLPSVFASGTVTYLEGDVSVLRGGNIIPADFGTVVNQGDRVATGDWSTVVIELDGRAEIKLRENSEVTIDLMGATTRVGLDSGSVFSRVRERAVGRYEVRARTVTGGVRGTEFFVAYGRRIEDEPDVWLCVNTGEVLVQVADTNKEMPVRAGEGVNILAGVRLTDARRYRWTERLNWNMNPSEGEVFDETDLDAAYSDLLDQDYD